MKLVQANFELTSRTLLSTFLSSKSKSTRDAYKIDLKCFQIFLRQNMNIDDVNTLMGFASGKLNFAVLKYRDYLLLKNFSSSTINRRLGAVRSLFKLARLIGISTAKIEIPNVKSDTYRDTKGPGLPAFKRMIKVALLQPNLKAARDHAILRLLFDLALRASELVELDLCHLDFQNNRVSIKGKGRAERQYLTLPNSSINALTQWVSIRGVKSVPLFYNLDRSNKNRRRLTRTGLYKLIRKIGQDANVKTRPHGVRHLSITEACKAAQNNGFALEEVMDHSRHKSVSTLMIYRDRERNVQGAIATLVSNSILEEKNEKI